MTTRGYTFGLYNSQRTARFARVRVRAFCAPEKEEPEPEDRAEIVRVNAILRRANEVGQVAVDASSPVRAPRQVGIVLHRQESLTLRPQRTPQNIVKDFALLESAVASNQQALGELKFGQLDADSLKARLSRERPLPLVPHAAGRKLALASLAQLAKLVRGEPRSDQDRDELLRLGLDLGRGMRQTFLRERWSPAPARGGVLETRPFRLDGHELRMATVGIDFDDVRPAIVQVELRFLDGDQPRGSERELWFVLPTTDQRQRFDSKAPVVPPPGPHP